MQITATVNPKPVISSSGGNVLKMGSTTLSVSNNTYDTYSWKKDNIAIASTPTLVVSAPGTYTVIVSKSTMTGSGTSVDYQVERALDQVQMNYVVVNSILKDGITSSSQVEGLSVADRSRAIQYLGGFGNGVQTIASQASPSGLDIVAVVEYDALGRQPKQYLPYVSSTNDSKYRANALDNGGYTGSEQYSFYQQTGNRYDTDTKPYSIATYEPSPLQRVTSYIGVGQDWHTANKSSQQQTLLNRATDNIILWKVDAVGNVTRAGTYGDYQLRVSVVTDEDGNTAKVYSDKSGKTILKSVQANTTIWHNTYYLYNGLGQLCYVLPPDAVQGLSFGSPGQVFLDKWAMQYRYDDLGRVVETRLPGKDWTYAVYDMLDRVVMTQDGEQRTRSEWVFTKFDVLGRAVAVGYKAISGSTRASVQASVTAQTNMYEITNSSSVGYTLDRTYPSAVESDLLSVSYYDNYNFLSLTGWDAEAHSFSFVSEMASTAYATRIQGMSTGAKVRVIDSATPSALWLNAVQYYDDFGRPLQIISENHLGTLDRVTNKYTFSRLVENLHTHGSSLTVLQKYQYDNAGRLLQIFHNINSAGSDQLVAQYEYNALGQLVDKKLHASGGKFLQSVDYRYNIRGWLRSINGTTLAANTDNNDSDSKPDHFGMELMYHQTETGLNDQTGDQHPFNGNIGAMKWKGPGAEQGLQEQKSYKYKYDKSGRLLNANFAVRGTAWNKETGALSESMTYDRNGNIATLQRSQRKYGIVSNVPAYQSETIDNLVYTYDTNVANRLLKVEDSSGKTEGFNNAVTATTEFTYDNTGNLKTDNNKGVTATTFNTLGKPYEITFSNGKKIQYTYSASGAKLTMKEYQGTTLQTTTDYVSGMVYVNGALSFFGSPEGRVVKNGSNYEYQYALADHQGNTRVVLSSAAAQQTAPSTGFETNPGTFDSYPSGGNLSALPLFNHTSGGTTSNKLTGGYSSQVGVGKSFKVYPGDTVTIRAYAKYEGTVAPPNSGFATSLLSAFSLSAPAPGETGTASSALNSFGTMVDGNYLYNDLDNDNAAPQAFVNIIAVDKGYNFVDAAWEQVPASAVQVGVSPVTPHAFIEAKYVAQEAGFVYLYVSNTSPVNVYFDDVQIIYAPSNVIQYNEYYPFGLQAATSWTRDNSSNNFLYNEASELNPTTGWYETFFRGYDAALGRFLQVDPLASASASWSPYHYGKNNPVYFNDPMGDAERPTPQERDPESATEVHGIWNPGYRAYGYEGGSPYAWGNAIRSVEQNAAMMSTRQFDAYYGLDNTSSQVNTDRRNQIGEANSEQMFIAWYDGDGNFIDATALPYEKRFQQSPQWDQNGDGRLSRDEANNWFRTGNGQAITVPLNSIDFSDIYASDVHNHRGFVNLYLKQSILSQLTAGGGDVFGTMRLEIVNGLEVKTPDGYFDVYDFDQDWSQWSRFHRNVGTAIGAAIAGDGTPFRIFFSGTATLGGYSRPATSK